MPASRGLKTQYGSKKYKKAERHNKLLHVATGGDADGIIKIHQDANIYVSEIDAEKTVDLLIKQGRQSYLVCIEGSLSMGGIELKDRDAVKIVGKEDISIATATGAHLLAIEMAID